MEDDSYFYCIGGKTGVAISPASGHTKTVLSHKVQWAFIMCAFGPKVATMSKRFIKWPAN